MYYKFYLNDTDVTERVSLGASINERFAEELDVGHITLSYFDDGDAKYVLSLVTIEEYLDDDTLDKTTRMYVANDTLDPITKEPPYMYKHDLTLIELTHKLDYYILNALTFVQPLEDTRDAQFEVSSYINYGGTITNDDVPSGSSETWAVDWHTEFPFKMRHVTPVTFEPIGESKVYNLHSEDRVFSEDTTANNHWIANVYKVEYDADNNETTTLVDENVDFSVNQLVFDETKEPGFYKVNLLFSTDTTIFSNDTTPLTLEREYDFYFKLESRKKYSMYDVIKRIRDVYPLEKKSIHEGTRLFNISTELEDKLKDIKAPQFFLSKLTVREAVNTVLKYVNGISRLVENGERLLTADYFNKRETSFIFDEADVFTLSSNQDNTNYVSNNRTFMSNVVGSAGIDKPSVKEMGEDGYKGHRSEELHLTYDTGTLFTQYSIYRLLKIVVKVFGYMQYTNMSQTNVEEVEEIEFDLDITPYIFEKSQWDLFDPGFSVFGGYGQLLDLFRNYGRNRKDDTAYYTYGDNKINVGSAVGEYFPNTTIERIISSATSERLHYYQGKYRNSTSRYVTMGSQETSVSSRVYPHGAGGDAGGGGSLTIDFDGSALPDEGDGVRLSIEELSFNVDYIALEDSVQDSYKEDTSIIDKYTEAVNHTNESIVNFERASIGNYGIAQRLGVPTINYSSVRENEELAPVGAVNQNREIIVERTRSFYPDHVMSSFVASKDFNRLAQYVAIDRAYRPYEVPRNRQTIQRDDIYTEFIEYSAHENTYTFRGNNTFMTYDTLETMLNTFLGDDTKEHSSIKQALVRTDGFIEDYPDEPGSKYAILMPTITQSGKHTLSFGMRFKDNIVAGYKIRRIKDTLLEDFNEPYGLWSQMVSYGDENGEFEYFHFTLLTNYDLNIGINEDYFDVTKNYPVVKSSGDAVNTYFTNQSANKMVQTGGSAFDDALVIKKDRGEIYSMTYQISYVPKDINAHEEVVIGNEFFEDNFLASDFVEKELYLYQHTDDDYYTTFGDNDVQPYATSEDASQACRFEEANGYIVGINCQLNTGTTHWSIGTAEGKLLLGVNSGTKGIVIFEPRNKRTSINYDW